MSDVETVLPVANVSSFGQNIFSFAAYKDLFHFSYTLHEDHCATFFITCPQQFVEHMYELAAHDQRQLIHFTGIDQKNVSTKFILMHYQTLLEKHLKEFLLKFCIVDFLYEQIHAHRITITTPPEITSFSLAYNQPATCSFQAHYAQATQLKEWKLFPFKMPKRKNYKDLDRQAEHLIHDEQNIAKQATQRICYLDWVFFKASITTPLPYFETFPLHTFLWLKMNDEEVNSPLRDLFLNKHIGDTFTTQCEELQTFFSPNMVTHYNFLITIIDVEPYNVICFNHFKHFFRIKTQKDLHKKLVEVFSFRNDISQRRSIVDEALLVLTQKHPFPLDPLLIDEQKKNVLTSIKRNPDYNVYKRQADFKQRVEELAQKQINDAIIVDQIAHNERMDVSLQDIKAYLNLTKRPRLRNFFCFELPLHEIDGQHIPIHLYNLKSACLREKTVNYIIYHLTKK